MSDREYQPFETRPDGDWFVVWFEQPSHVCTLIDGEPILRDSVMLFQSKDEALRRFSQHTVKSYGFSSARELSHYIAGKELVTIYNRMRLTCAKYREAPRSNIGGFSGRNKGMTPAQWENAYIRGELQPILDDPLLDEMASEPLKVATKVWAQFQEAGEKVRNTWLDGDPGTNTHATKMYRVHVDRLRSPEGQAVIAKLPKQARVVATGFAELGESYLNEDELEVFALNLKRDGKLKTKQSGERIVRYYLPCLADSGFVDYKGRRKAGDEVKA